MCSSHSGASIFLSAVLCSCRKDDHLLFSVELSDPRTKACQVVKRVYGHINCSGPLAILFIVGGILHIHGSQEFDTPW